MNLTDARAVIEAATCTVEDVLCHGELLATARSLLAKVEAVEALADELSEPSPFDGHGMRAPIDPDHVARRLRAALSKGDE